MVAQQPQDEFWWYPGAGTVHEPCGRTPERVHAGFGRSGRGGDYWICRPCLSRTFERGMNRPTKDR